MVNSVGSRGDSYDNATAESFIRLYKAELVLHEGPWEGLEDVERATLPYVDWFNNRPLHGEIGIVAPAEFEAAYYRQINRPRWLFPKQPSLDEPGPIQLYHRSTTRPELSSPWANKRG